MHSCILAEFVYAERQKDTGSGVQAFATAVCGKLIGKIVGGVIGTNKLRYDIWGVDVITAHKLEANGTPGKVLASLGACGYVHIYAIVFF